jgi:hypothetical protein
MPFDLQKIEKLEKLLVRTDIPVQKKVGIERNINKVEWLARNFDIRNHDHPKRDEIMALIKDILRNE